MELYEGQPQAYVAVDCVILGYDRGELKLLLKQRAIEPAKGKWSLLGGFVQPNESLNEAALRVLQFTTGLKNIVLQQLEAFSEPQRDPGGRVISVAFMAFVLIGQHDQQLVQSHGAKWWPITRVPELIFDHAEMVRRAVVHLQWKAGYELVGRGLLPERFTFLQLRQLYEAIYQRSFDPGNFRKKVLSLNALRKLDQKNTTDSKKGAFYYEFIQNPDDTRVDRIVRF